MENYDEFCDDLDDDVFLQALASVEANSSFLDTSNPVQPQLKNPPNASALVAAPSNAPKAFAPQSTAVRDDRNQKGIGKQGAAQNRGNGKAERQRTLMESFGGGSSGSGQQGNQGAARPVVQGKVSHISGAIPTTISSNAKALKSAQSATVSTPTSPASGYIPNLHKVDPEAMKTWIYPTNVSVRDYQFNIVSRSLFVNTLVALPTGLGKTFIAAVVMFNYFRWFPEGRIVFMAPTKPLVAQQIEACFKITGIPQNETEELTGATAPEQRRSSWINKRVFFLTPQVMQNDLNRGTCPAEKVVLLVIDEAHRATGNHAYCEVIRELRQRNQRFRVLALTATPGADTKTVQQVVQNVLVSRIEIRTEDSLDIKPYIHQRSLEVVTVALSEQIIAIRSALNKIMEIYIGRLCRAKAFYRTDPQNIGRYELLMARDRWREENRNRQGTTGGITPGRAASLEGDFGVAMSLAAALQLLQVHGIRTCFTHLESYLEESRKSGVRISRSRAELLKNRDFLGLLDTIRGMIEAPNYSSHPKLERLVSTVVNHFVEYSEETERLAQQGRSNEQAETRVMVFSQYRESVEEIKAALEEHKPMVRVMSFVGQSSGGKSNKKGFTQKEQLQVISQFQKGNHNVLVATSIGEEGLDIGEVDLIICYDVQNSPIRMLQRMGRTGRKREGKVVLLLTEGKEEDAHRRSQAQYKTVQKAIMDQQGKRLQMYPETLCRMIPPGVKPVCVKMEIDIPEKDPIPDRKKKKRLSDSKRKPDPIAPLQALQPLLNSEELAEYNAKYALPKPSGPLSLTRFTYWQTRELPELIIQRSERTKAFVGSIKLMEQLALDEEEHKPSNYAQRIKLWLNPDDMEVAGSSDEAARISSKKKRILCRRRKSSDGACSNLSDASDDVVDTPLVRQTSKVKRKIVGIGKEIDSDDDLTEDSDICEATEVQNANKRLKHDNIDKSPTENEHVKPKNLAGQPSENPIPNQRSNLPTKETSIAIDEWDSEWGSDEALLIFDPVCDEEDPVDRHQEKSHPHEAQCPSPPFLPPPLLQQTADAVLPKQSLPALREEFVTDNNITLPEDDLFCTYDASEEEHLIQGSFLANLEQIEKAVEIAPSPKQGQPVFKVPDPVSAPKERGKTNALNAESMDNVAISCSQTPMPARKKKHRLFLDDSPLSQALRRTSIGNRRDAFDEFSGSQWASQVPARALKRLRKVNNAAKHISVGSASQRRCSQSVKKSRRLRVDSLIARLAQKKHPRKPPKQRGTPVVTTKNQTEKEKREPGKGSRRKKLPAELNPFVEHEAELSADEDDVSSDETADEDWNRDLQGFVVGDETTPAATPSTVSSTSAIKRGSPTDIRAFYQKSLLSPAMGGFGRMGGGYKFAWGRVTPGRRFNDTPGARADEEDSEEEDPTLSGFIVDDEEVEEPDSSQQTLSLNNEERDVSESDEEIVALKRAYVNDNEKGEGEEKKPQNKKIRVTPEQAPEYDSNNGNHMKKRATASFGEATNRQSLSNGAVSVDPERVCQTKIARTSKPWQKAAAAAKGPSINDSTLESPGWPLPPKSLVADTPAARGNALDTIAQAAIQDCMEIDWEDDGWDDEPDNPSLASAKKASPLSKGKTPLSKPGQASIASLLPFALHDPSPSKDNYIKERNAPEQQLEKVEQCHGDKVTILVDTREMRSPICSLLRNKYRIRTEIRQLAFGDYVISNRIAVERKTKSDLLNSVYNKRIYEQINSLKSMCENPMLIIEKEEEGPQSMAATTQLEGIVASLLRIQLTVLFSDSAEQTAEILHNIAMKEATDGSSIDVPDVLPNKNDQALQVLLSIPGISDVTAIAIMNAQFCSFQEFVNSDVEELVKRIPDLTRSRATTIHSYLRKIYQHQENSDDTD